MRGQRWERPQGPDDWLDAADAADFSFYELARPEPSHLWGGGFGWGQDGTRSIEVVARVQRAEITIAETPRLGMLPSLPD